MSRYLSYGLMFVAAVSAWWAPAILDEYGVQILLRLLVGVVLAEAWNLLAGYTGLVSLGTSSAVGVGAYLAIPLLNATGMTLAVATGIAATGGALLALCASPGLLRLRGLYFTVGTLALAELLRLLMINVERFGGATGFFLDRDPPEPRVLVHAFVLLLLVTWLIVTRLGRGPWSVVLRAVRDDEDVAAQFGVRPFQVKLMALLLASAIMAAAGGLQAVKLGAIEPYGLFGLRWSVDTLSMVVIGGIGQAAGPVVGAVFVVLTSELLADHPEAHLALTGVLLIVMMRFAPRGIAGLGQDVIQRWRGHTA